MHSQQKRLKPNTKKAVMIRRRVRRRGRRRRRIRTVKQKRHPALGCGSQGMCLYPGTVVSYLLGSDFLCLTAGNLLYYRTSINKRKGKALAMNTCKTGHEFQDENLAVLAAQTVPYEFEQNTESKERFSR